MTGSTWEPGCRRSLVEAGVTTDRRPFRVLTIGGDRRDGARHLQTVVRVRKMVATPGYE